MVVLGCYVSLYYFCSVRLDSGLLYCYDYKLHSDLVFFPKKGGLMAFPTQVRIVYFVFTLFGVWAAVRFPLYIVLLIGTVMVTFTGRCVIALLLKPMPWNKNMAPGASCEIGSVEK